MSWRLTRGATSRVARFAFTRAPCRHLQSYAGQYRLRAVARARPRLRPVGAGIGRHYDFAIQRGDGVVAGGKDDADADADDDEDDQAPVVLPEDKPHGLLANAVWSFFGAFAYM